ncbi:MAG TPA: hypothetical protein PLZ84_05355, partial [Clostridia bacterium]|nr:hypothetical protein [Clostridia bacterium]
MVYNGRYSNIFNLIKFGLLIIFFLCLFFIFTVFIGIGKWQNLRPDRLENLKQTTIVYDIDNKPVANIYGTENRTKIRIETLPE